MATGSANPWEEPLDDSYWQTLLNEVEYVAPSKTSSSEDFHEEYPTDQYAGGQDPGIPQIDFDFAEIDPPAEDFHGIDSRPMFGEDGVPRTDQDKSDWDQAADILEKKTVIQLNVTGYNRGGLLVRFGGLQGFVPSSQLCVLPGDISRQADLSCRVGRSLKLRIIELDRDNNRLIFSERAASRDNTAENLLCSLAPGQVWDGRVTSLCAFGAFVDLGGVEGFVHISEFSWGRVDHPSDVLKPGDEVQVYIVSVEPAQCRVSLSLKQLKPNPWTELEDRYQIGQVVTGKVTNVVNFGAFVRVEEGLEGLIHVSELAEGNFLHPRNVVKEGDEVTARIIRIDGSNHRLGLTLRQSPQPDSDQVPE